MAVRRPVDFDVALEAEIHSEQAAALKAAAVKLQEALAKLETCKASERKELVQRAAVRAWHYIVQRESMGLTHTTAALDFYKVPGEVRRHIGATPVVRAGASD